MAKLTDQDRLRFMRAVKQLVDALKNGEQPPAGLRLKKVQANGAVWELTWAPDGRATFEYGPPVKGGEVHVTWRRIGGHEIFKNP